MLKNATDALKATSKIAVLKTAETSGDLINNKITVTITKFSRITAQNISGAVQMKQNILSVITKYLKKDIFRKKTENYCLSEINMIV